AKLVDQLHAGIDALDEADTKRAQAKERKATPKPAGPAAVMSAAAPTPAEAVNKREKRDERGENAARSVPPRRQQPASNGVPPRKERAALPTVDQRARLPATLLIPEVARIDAIPETLPRPFALIEETSSEVPPCPPTCSACSNCSPPPSS